MELLNDEQCKQWCSENNIGILDSRIALQNPGKAFASRIFSRNKCEFRRVFYPEKYNDCVYVTMVLSRYFAEFETESLFWMTDWGIWSEDVEAYNRFLWTRLRPDLSYESLSEFPGHLCGPDDAEYVRGLILLSMLSQWDGHWIPKGGESYIYVCHHKWITAATKFKKDEDIKDLLDWCEDA
jgi:hypothetical protein